MGMMPCNCGTAERLRSAVLGADRHARGMVGGRVRNQLVAAAVGLAEGRNERLLVLAVSCGPVMHMWVLSAVQMGMRVH